MPDQRSGGGPRGGPPGFGPFAGARSATLLSFAAAALLAAVWQRKRLLPADRTVILAAALAAAVVGGPWFDGDKAMRLVPMAAVLLAITLPFLLGLIPWRLIAALASSVVIAASAASAALYLPRGGEPTIGENAFAELRALRRQVEAGNRTLIVARHGLEWWTAWTLHTHIAQPTAVTKEDWSTFDRVLYLVENDTPNHHRRPPRDAGLRFDGPPRRLRDQPAPSGASNGDDFPPPPGNFGGPRGAPGGGAFTNRLPENARILHKGAALTLAQADTPPESLLRPRPRPESAR